MKILIATKNPGKAKELRGILEGTFEVVSLADLQNAPDVEEAGKTFEENSLLKAKTYFEWSGIPSVADDGGLEIDALGGEPGVKSRRWPSFAEATEGKPGSEKTDQELIDLALQKLEGVPPEKRTARLRTVGTYYDGTHVLAAAGSIEGSIVEHRPAVCEPGYPFRAIFWVPRFGKVYSDLTHEEHDAVNHRRAAYGELIKKILQLSPSVL